MPSWIPLSLGSRMVIWVVGAGGVGGWIAHQLAACGEPVHLVVREGKESEWIRTGIRLVTEDGPLPVQEIPVASDPRALPAPDLVVISVKTPSLPEVLQRIGTRIPVTATLLMVQNGLGAGELAKAMVPGAAVLHAPVFVQAWTTAPGEVTALRPRRIVLPENSHLVSLFHRAGVEVETTPDVRQALWRKAAFLVPFAALDLELKGGAEAILGDPRYEELVRELCLFAAVEGHPLGTTAVADILAFTRTLPPDAHSSLRRDVQAGREGEWEDLIGWCQRRSRSRFLELSVLHSLRNPLAAKV